MNRRSFLKRLLAVAVVVSVPIPALHRRVTRISDDFEVKYGSVRWVGNSDAQYTVNELYTYLQEELDNES